MNRIYIFRTFMLVILIAFFATKIGQLNSNHGAEYYTNALDALGNATDARAQLTKFKIQKLTEYVFYVLIIIYSRKLFFDRINNHNIWYLSFPTSIIASAIIGLLLAYIVSIMNPYYYLSPYNGVIKSSSRSLFTLLHLRLSVHFFFAVCSSCIISEIEKILDSEEKQPSLKILDLRFWIALFALHFIVTTLLMQYMVVGSSGVFYLILQMPVVLLASVGFTLISYVIIDAFVDKARIRFDNLFDKLSRTLIASFGVLGLFYFTIELNLSFGSRWLGVSLNPAIIITLIMFLIVLILTLLYFQFNSQKVKAALKLHENLEERTSELSLLKSQINPHFLFNSLNTLYGLALNEESPKTAHAVQQLSEMMRFMLHENHAEKIPLQKEIDYLRNYIELQTLRISQKDHFQLEVDVAEGCQGEITPMVLIPFVENAFKHGVSFQKPSWVKIKLACNAEEVHLNVQNSVHKHGGDPEKGKSGIGLENVRKRLGILYPEKHLFQIYETEDSFEANIKITLI